MADPTTLEREQYIAQLIEEAAALRLPGLFDSSRPGMIYGVPDRQGVAVVMLPTTSLTPTELTTLMIFRFAQYLICGFFDPAVAFAKRLRHEPLSAVSEADIHCIAGVAETGELLCYATVRAAPQSAPEVTLRSRERGLFPVEHVHGWGMFNRIRGLADLPVSRIREIGRFVKNQQIGSFNQHIVRAPVEIMLGLIHILMRPPLSAAVDAIIGDFEEGVAKRNMDFFHIPLIYLQGTIPYATSAALMGPRYLDATVYPFALLTADLAWTSERLAAVEAALALPGKQALLALAELNKTLGGRRSGLEPDEGLPPLNTVSIPQHQVPMDARRTMLDVGARLRLTDLFSDLSVAEAAVLGTFMRRRQLDAGTRVVGQGEPGDALYIIESGTAMIQVRTTDGQAITVATLGPGDYFGEIALLTDDVRTADVLARTPMVLLELSKAAYTDYLAYCSEVEHKLTAVATQRAARRAAQRPAIEQWVGATAVFAALTSDQAGILGTFMERQYVAPGTTIVQQGDAGDAVYLIEAGYADVLAAGPDQQQLLLTTLGPGEYFGEIALVTGLPRAATVTASSPMTVVRLSRAGYEQYLSHGHGMGEAA